MTMRYGVAIPLAMLDEFRDYRESDHDRDRAYEDDLDYYEMDEVPRGKRSYLTLPVVILIVANLLLFGVYIATGIDGPAAAETRIVQPVEREEGPPPQTRSSRPPPISAPRRTPIFTPKGDMSDIFCRPWAEETEEAWRARVPAYCR